MIGLIDSCKHLVDLEGCKICIVRQEREIYHTHTRGIHFQGEGDNFDTAETESIHAAVSRYIFS